MHVLGRFTDPFAKNTADPAELRALGEKAAHLYRNGESTLGDAVVQVIGDRKLNNNHVQRVLEFANIAAFKHAYRSAAGPERIVSFEGGPADPEHVLERLRGPATADGSVKKSAASVAGLPAELATPVYRLMENKLASWGGPSSDPAAVLRKLDEEIASRRVKLAVLEEKLASALYDLCTHARRALIDGATFGDISFVMGSAVPGRPQMVKRAMDNLMSILGPELGMDAGDAQESISKRAHKDAKVNLSHPLPRAAVSYVRIADELEETKHAEILLRSARSRLRGTICFPRKEV